jgi:selenium metabolism protein YedF
MSRVVDARGLACPQPVILTRKAMEDETDLVTLVDSETSRDNVRRMAEKVGRTVAVSYQDGAYQIHISGAPGLTRPPSHEAVPGLVLVVSDNQMGRGDPELGKVLIRGFFHTLVEALGKAGTCPQTVIFFNAGVWLTLDDSPVLEDLRALGDQGVTMLACGTCLRHYGVLERLAVGQVSNMYDIAEAMLSAGRVVTL